MYCATPSTQPRREAFSNVVVFQPCHGISLGDIHTSEGLAAIKASAVVAVILTPMGCFEGQTVGSQGTARLHAVGITVPDLRGSVWGIIGRNII
jgi:hypothetical protein